MTACPVCFLDHQPRCNAEWDEPCLRCGRSVGGHAEGVPEGVCWRCHMGFVEQSAALAKETKIALKTENQRG